MINKPKIPAIVINLANATSRWNFQQQQLELLNINHQRFEATTVDDLSLDEYEKWANDWQRKLRKTEVACFLSHYRVWQHIAKSNQTYLVLEDDALLSKQLPIVLDKLSKNDNLHFDHLTFETRGRKKMIGKDSIYNFDGLSLHELYLDKTGAAAYLLTPTGAQKLLLEVNIKGAGLADALLCHTKSLKKLQSMPALAIQMDMADHYGMPELVLKSVAKSNISTEANIKPTPNTLSDKLLFKSRRLAAQIDMGLVQAKHSKHSDYLELNLNTADYAYLAPLLHM